MNLYNEKGKLVSLYEICEWWIEKYPEDVFVRHPLVVPIRKKMKKILEIRDNPAKEEK